VQIAFYLETGSEIKWGSANKFAHDLEGLKVLLSGLLPAFFVSVLLAVIARLISQPLCTFPHPSLWPTKQRTCNAPFLTSCLDNGVHFTFYKMVETFASQKWKEKLLSRELNVAKEWQDRDHEDEDEESVLDYCPSPNRSSFEDEPFLNSDQKPSWLSKWFARAAFLGPLITVLILLTVRPRNPPYAHMSSSIPYTLWDIFKPYSEELCGAGHREFPPFPLPDLLDVKYWERPNDKFIGWMPTVNSSSHEESDKLSSRPSWLPEKAVLGFDRWYDRPFRPEHHRRPHPPPPKDGPPHRGPHHRRPKIPKYNPIKDPLKISNLEKDILGPIAQAVKDRKVKIKHIVIATLESTRKDIFPMKKDSHLYDLILKTHTSGEEVSRVESELANLTPNTELLTGEVRGFPRSDSDGARAGGWRNLTEGRGGINIQGAFTGSTTSLKSLIGSHCGVQPLAVDFTVESHGHIYQPCLPAILRLLNQNKQGDDKLEARKWGFGKQEDDMTSRPWRVVSAQAVTNKFDHQDELNSHLGFSEVVAKDDLLDPSFEFPATMKQSNYFGFPDDQLKPYFQNLFRDAKKNDERLFLSHFTGATHHPWNLPEGFGEPIEFLKKGRWSSEHQLNRYLNTVKYGDWWLGQIMDMLEDEGLADETLVVMVGDQ